MEVAFSRKVIFKTLIQAFGNYDAMFMGFFVLVYSRIKGKKGSGMISKDVRQK